MAVILGIAHEIVEELVSLEDRGLQPPHPGQGGAMAGFEIVEFVVRRHTTCLADDTVGERPQRGKLLALDQARDDQVAVPAIGLDLRVGKHAKQ